MSDDTIWHFVVDGDIHGSNPTSKDFKIRDDKKDMASRLTRISKEYPIDFVLCIGDLTNDGWDGQCATCCFKTTWPNRKKNQLKAFRKLYEKPIEDAGFPVYLCIGNHDLTTGKPYVHRGVLDHVLKKHNASHCVFRSPWYSGNYTFKHNGVKFICLGVWPNTLGWLQDHLPKNKDKPVVIWYHYNTIVEPWSDFWSSEDKLKFYSTIRGYNIVAICNGHSHDTKVGLFHDIPTIRGSGSKNAIVGIKNGKLEKVIYDDGKDETISKTDRFARFQKWRQVQTSRVIKYDKENRNQPHPDAVLPEDKL